MDMNVDVEPDWVALTAESDRGAEALGFSGTAAKRSQRATGLTALVDGGFGDGPRIPMLPNTWTSGRN
jgi:PPE-repeat protein